MKRIIVPFLFALLLSACGFHLRGLQEIPEWLNNVSIISNSDDKQLASLLKIQLESYKINVNPDPALAQYWLTINNTNLRQQIVSIGASTNPRQYQLIMTAEFMLQTNKGQIIKAPRQVVVSRQLTVNNDRILGSNAEETVLLGEMRQEMVVQMINRLSRE